MSRGQRITHKRAIQRRAQAKTRRRRARQAAAALTATLTALALAPPAPADVYIDAISQVKDINLGQMGNDSSNVVVMGGKLYFAADDGISGSEIWRSDGTAAGTQMITNIQTEATSIRLTNLAAVGGKIFFQGYDPIHGAELWSTDGSSAGASMVADINPGGAWSMPTDLVPFGSKVYFAASGPTGWDLWSSDGTQGGTKKVKDLPETNPPLGKDDVVDKLTVVGGKLFFVAPDNDLSYQLWVSDGTTAGTNVVKHINNAGGSSPFIYGFGVMNGKVYFGATTDVNQSGLWSSDGTEAGTILVHSFTGSSRVTSDDMAVMGGHIYFSGSDPNHGWEPWKSDGIPGGNTDILKDIRPGGGESYPDSFATFNNEVYFQATNGINGRELWRTDGTSAKTVMVRDLAPSDSRPRHLTALGQNLFFTADDGTTGEELWKLSKVPNNEFTPPAFGTPVGNKGNLALAVNLPGPGILSVNPVGVRVKQGKKFVTVTYTKPVTVAVLGPGATGVTLVPTPAATKILNKRSKGKKIGRLQVTVTMTFTPTGGTPNSKVATYTLVKP